MTINIPESIRGWLYVLVIIGGPVVAYLMATGVFHEAEFALWSGITSAIALIARFNLGDSPHDPE